MTLARDVVEAARSFIGVAYRHQGRTRAGLDCIGLNVAIAIQLHLPAHDFSAYAPTPDPVALLREVSKGMDSVATRDGLAPGHSLMFRLTAHGPPQHFAILTEDGTMVHALSTTGSVVEVTFDRMWQRLLCGAWAFKGVEY